MKFFNHTLIIITLVAACIGYSQTSETSQLCDQAEDLIKSHPDFALELLSNYTLPDNASKRDIARFSLLLSQAYHKNFIDLTNDSIIRIATDYFSNSGEKRLEMLSHYLHGFVLFNAGRYFESTQHTLKALDLAQERKDTLYMARAYDLIGMNHQHMMTFSEMEHCYRSAAALYKSIDRHNNYISSLRGIVSCYTSTKRYKESLRLIDSIYPLMTEREKMGALGYSILSHKFNNLVSLQQPEKALSVFDSMQRCFKRKCQTVSYVHAAYAYIQLKDYENAKNMIRNAYEAVSDSIDLLMTQEVDCQYLKGIGNFKESQRISDSLIYKENRYIEYLLDQSAVKAERDYYENDAALTKTRAQKEKSVFTISLGIAVGLIILILGVMHIRTKRNKRLLDEKSFQLSTLIDRNEQYEEVLIQRQANMDLWKKNLHKSMGYQIKMINLILEAYSEIENPSDAKERKLAFTLKNRVGKIKALIGEVVDQVNTHHDNILDKLQASDVKFSEKELYFIALAIVGFSSKAISLLLDYKNSSFYTIRRRIAKKLQETGIADAALLALFE